MEKENVDDSYYRQMRTDVFCGVTVALALVPEAVAFSFVAGVEPKIGLLAAWMMCLITGYFGGRPGMISAATGAMAVVMAPYIKENGVEHLFPIVMLTGVIQLTLASFQFGSFTKFISEAVMIGFCNGLAIVIGWAQLELFQEGHHMPYVTGTQAWITCFEVFLTMGIAYGLPKLTTVVPGSLVAIVVVTCLEYVIRAVFDESTATIEDFERIEASFPVPFFLDHDFSFDDFGSYFFVSVRLALVGLIESLLTLKLVDAITNSKGDPRRECFAQGFANLVTGFFGGMGGCAMIGQSMINVNGGARWRISSYVSGLTLFLLVCALSQLLNVIPVSSLIGVMFVVVLETFEWQSLGFLARVCMSKEMRAKVFDDNLKIERTDVFIMFLVTVVTLISDLAIAVLTGIAFSSAIFVWSQRNPKFTALLDEESGAKIYCLDGPIFFASCEEWIEIFDYVNDPKEVVLHINAEVCDYSAIRALNIISMKYESYGKHLSLKISCGKSTKLIQKAESLLEKCQTEYVDDYKLSDMIEPNVMKRGQIDLKEVSDPDPDETCDQEPAFSSGGTNI